MPKASSFTDHSTGTEPETIAHIGEGMLAAGIAMALFTPRETLHFATPGFIELYDIQPGQQSLASILRHCAETGVGPVFEADDIEPWLVKNREELRHGGSLHFEVAMRDGRWVLGTKTQLSDGWIVLVITDFTAVKRREFRLESDRDAALIAAETDHLTGIYNRGATMVRFGRLVERATKTGEVFSAVLIDLDMFKAINDQHGHDGGDQVLVHFAACATQALRERDILGRVGGEEFLIIMPGATRKQAHTVIERLQAHVRDQRLILGGATLRYTFSAGIAEWKRSKTLDGLYHEADQALYAAKHAGRNQVKLAG
ncbi:GGDEF domain-containing protein [Asticcacaulis benevestitus]|nr:sensor domain-containing diguanylate cyclase [Asticcacaulis benevestitus]